MTDQQCYCASTLIPTSSLSQAGFKPHYWCGVWVKGRERCEQVGQTASVGHSRPGTVPLGDTELLPWGGRCPVGLRYIQVIALILHSCCDILHSYCGYYTHAVIHPGYWIYPGYCTHIICKLSKNYCKNNSVLMSHMMFEGSCNCYIIKMCVSNKSI